MTFVLWFLLQAHAFDATPARLQAVMAESRRATFAAADGLSLSYTVFGESTTPAHPIVISPGKGETAFRYVELIEQLMRNGHGPIYVLDHRGQGFSGRQTNTRSLVHVNRFEDYVDDFIAFVKGPLARELNVRGIQDKPALIAHSMGGAIAMKALLREPGLLDRPIYIAPMVDLNTGPLNMWNDRPALWAAEILCRLGFCDGIGFGLRNSGRPRRQHRPIDVAALEEQNGVSTGPVSAGWLRSSVRATWEIRAEASKHREPSLVLIAKQDKMVDNAATRAYVCAAGNCELKEVRGPHSMHQGADKTQSDMLGHILKFLTKECAREI